MSFLNRVAAGATTPPRLHPLLGSFFDAGVTGQDAGFEPHGESIGEPRPSHREPQPYSREAHPAVREPQPLARAVDWRDGAPLPPATISTVVESVSAVRGESEADARGKAPATVRQGAREFASEDIAPVRKRTAQSANGGRRVALSSLDERSEPVVHPLEPVPPLDSQPRAVAAAAASANEPAALTARNQPADGSVRFAREETRTESVQIHIGRLEVIAVPEPAQRKPVKNDTPKYMSLDAHLARRSGRAG